MRHPDHLACQVRPIDRVRENKHQRRDDAVHRRRRHAGIALFDLEPAHVIRRSSIRRAPQERREAPHIANVVALRLSREPAHVHIVDQTLAQWADRSGGDWGRSSVGSSRLKEAETLRPHRAVLNRATPVGPLLVRQYPHTPPAKRVVLRPNPIQPNVRFRTSRSSSGLTANHPSVIRGCTHERLLWRNGVACLDGHDGRGAAAGGEVCEGISSLVGDNCGARVGYG